MISYLEGKIIIKKEKFIVLNVNGVGYRVFLSKKAISMIPEIGGPVKLFCFLNVRETAMDLYGFLGQEELEFFELLGSIRGIGPKAALEISSLGPVDEIKKKILEQDEKIFEGIPGIGKKKAAAIILELSGKIKDIYRNKEKGRALADRAEEGLIALGFSRQSAKQALSGIPKEIKNSDQRVKEALKLLDKSKGA